MKRETVIPAVKRVLCVLLLLVSLVMTFRTAWTVSTTLIDSDTIRTIHGEGDRFVPPEMSEEIALANPKMVERHTFADAGHGLSYFYDTERYKSIVKDFLKKHP